MLVSLWQQRVPRWAAGNCRIRTCTYSAHTGSMCEVADGYSVILPWHVWVAYLVINVFAFAWNCYAKWLPVIAQISISTSLISFFVILVTVPAKAPTHQDAKFVFANFVNNTGWSANGIAFIVGLINTNYAFACLDCATHLAEEVNRPEKMVPIAIMGTVAIGFVTSWSYAIALFFSMDNLDDLQTTSTLVPILALFYQALGSKAGAIVLESLFIATGIWCLVASHTWQSRLCWSFARDGGLPFSKFLSHVDPRVEVPLRAHFVSCFIVTILGLLYLGSYTAFNSMVTACIVLLYVSYAIPVICLLIKGRNNIRHGPFWLGPFGLFANIVLLLWTCFTIIMYSFPPVRPVTGGSMSPSPCRWEIWIQKYAMADRYCRYELRFCRIWRRCIHHPRGLACAGKEGLQRTSYKA